MKLKSIVTSQYKKKFDYHKGKRLSFEDKTKNINHENKKPKKQK